MNFKAMLLVCLLLLASISTIVIASLSIVTNKVKQPTSASGFSFVKPFDGGDPIDDPNPI